MKFRSLQSLGLAFKTVLLRFPLEIAFALIGTLAATVNIELSDLEFKAENYCIRLLMIASFGLVLSLSATLFSESKGYSGLKKNLLRVLVVLLTIGLFFLIDPLKRETEYLRFVLLALSFHLLVSFAAFTGKGRVNAFWQFNKIIFLRFLTGGLYSAVLFLGLAAAIGSMNFLFNFQFDWDTFAILWVWIVGLFQTLFFLSGVPENLSVLEKEKSYPKGLKIFTQYVLIPLATVYAIILLAYEAEILIEWELPKGLVSNLILGYAVFGILSLLLIYPVRNLDENKWLKTYSRNFYYLLIPLIILLIWAVLVRVIDYGITEERYFLIVLAGWLSFITAYFLLSKRQDISIIPLSLCIVTLLSIYGPQGAFSTSKRSQSTELKQLFQKYKAIDGDRIRALKIDPAKEDKLRIINIIDYLVNMHGLESFQPLLKQDLNNMRDSLIADTLDHAYHSSMNRWEIRSKQKNWLYKHLNIKPAGGYNTNLTGKKYTIKADKMDFVPLNKADYLINLNLFSDSSMFLINQTELRISHIKNENKFRFEYGPEVKYLSLDTLIRKFDREVKKQDIEPISASRKFLSQNLKFNEISLEISWNRINFNDDMKLTSANGFVLVSVK